MKRCFNDGRPHMCQWMERNEFFEIVRIVQLTTFYRMIHTYASPVLFHSHCPPTCMHTGLVKFEQFSFNGIHRPCLFRIPALFDAILQGKASSFCDPFSWITSQPQYKEGEDCSEYLWHTGFHLMDESIPSMDMVAVSDVYACH